MGAVEVLFMFVAAPSECVCWWRSEHGHDCDIVTTVILCGRTCIMSCEAHRLEVADLLSRHTDCVLMSG